MIVFFNLLFLACAAICNAIMDKSVHHYSTSIFSELNPFWWDGAISWRNKYNDRNSRNGRVKWKIFGISFNKPVQITDAFHFFKTLMIIFICLSIITFDKCVALVGCDYTVISFLIMLFIYGTVWNLTFSLFYNFLLKRH